MKFKVGDRVRAVKNHDGRDIIGKIGTVKTVDDNLSYPFGIEFDKNIGGHACSGKGKNGHCWWCPESVLEPVCNNGEIEVGKKYCVTCSGLENGNVIEITKIDGGDAYYKTLVGVNPSQTFFGLNSDFCKGLIPYIDNKIVITADGKTTTAKLYDGKKFVESAKAVCSPDDEFDFNIGATIALERLTGHVHGQLESTLEEKPKFTKADLKTGMFVQLEGACWGVVVDNSIILEDGRYCDLNDLNSDLATDFGSSGITVVVKADCFNRAREYFKHTPDKVVFKR